jgi:hypothetical protein
MKKIIVLSIFAISIWSCGPKKTEEIPYNVFFDSEQPVKDKNLNDIPKSYWGTYAINEYRKLLVQSQAIIIQNISPNNVLLKSELDSLTEYFEMREGKLFNKKSQELYTTRLSNDSIYYDEEYLDTIFAFRPDESIREFKGSLVMNFADDGKYKVNWIDFGFMTRFVEIATEEDFYKIKLELKLTEDQYEYLDSTHFLLKFDQAHFRKLHRMEGFSYETIF